MCLKQKIELVVDRVGKYYLLIFFFLEISQIFFGFFLENYKGAGGGGDIIHKNPKFYTHINICYNPYIVSGNCVYLK